MSMNSEQHRRRFNDVCALAERIVENRQVTGPYTIEDAFETANAFFNHKTSLRREWLAENEKLKAREVEAKELRARLLKSRRVSSEEVKDITDKVDALCK